MVPIGAVAHLGPAVAPALITQYNLYPSSTIIGAPGKGFSSGQALTTMETIAKKVLPGDVAFEWTAMSYQEKITGNQLYIVFALSISRQARRVIYQNLTFALAVIVVLIISALGFSLLLPIGVIGHEGSTVLVCLNGLRLLTFRKSPV